MWIIALLVVGIIIEKVWSPRLDWVEEEDLLLMYYNKKNTRSYFIIIKF